MRQVEVASSHKHSWRQICAEYEVLLYGQGREQRKENNTSQGQVTRKGMDVKQASLKQKEADEVAKSERRKYAVKRYASEMIQHRIRHFQDGVAIGSKEFIEEVFEQKRDFFSPNRESGARRIPLSKDAIYTMRTLNT